MLPMQEKKLYKQIKKLELHHVLFKKVKNPRTIVFPVGILMIVIIMFGIVVFFQSVQSNQKEHKTNESTNQKTQTIDVESLKKEQFDLWINDSGPYNRTFYFHKNEKISIRLATKDNNLNYIIDSLLKRNLVTMQVEGVNHGKNLNINKVSDRELSASYIASKAGKDKIKVSIPGSTLTFQSNVIILDPSYFAIPIDLIPENISFTTANFLSVKSKDTYQPGWGYSDPTDRSMENTEFFHSGMNTDYPGHIGYKFTSDGKEFEYAYLAIYAIADGALAKYDADNSLDAFPYLENLQALTQTIAKKPALPDRLPILGFPQVNASIGPVSHVSFLNFQNGTGVRYLIAGWYQAVVPSDFPTYTYQGITADGKYQILFRYSKLYSPLLDTYLKTELPLPNHDQDLSNKYYSGSFDAVKMEENFSPSIDELDQFVKSLHVGK
jgi:hypothetical protein